MGTLQGKCTRLFLWAPCCVEKKEKRTPSGEGSRCRCDRQPVTFHTTLQSNPHVRAVVLRSHATCVAPNFSRQHYL